MDDRVDAGHQWPKGLAVADVGFMEREIGMRPVGQEGVAAVDERVDDGDRLAAVKQFAAQMRAEISGAAGNKNFFFRHSLSLGPDLQFANYLRQFPSAYDKIRLLGAFYQKN